MITLLRVNTQREEFILYYLVVSTVDGLPDPSFHMVDDIKGSLNSVAVRHQHYRGCRTNGTL